MTAGSELPYPEDAEDPQKTQNFDLERPGLSHAIIGAAVEVQKVLGVGLLESAYAGALALELAEQGLRFRREVTIEALYKGVSLGVGYRADFIVEDAIILELKVLEMVLPNHKAQLLSYLRLANLKLGLLINFNEFPVTRGVHRVVNKV
jgi:GxxExxY protein